MKFIKSFFIAFSFYSKIPVPQFEWKQEDMKYALCFFPWVGALIGVCVYFWGDFCLKREIGVLCYTFIAAAIPLLITGGFHADGFMDTMDAFHSYQPKESSKNVISPQIADFSSDSCKNQTEVHSAYKHKYAQHEFDIE